MKKYFFYGILLSIPVYTWIKLCKTWMKLHKEYKNRELFTRRHNCVVTYKSNQNIAGWPNSKNPVRNSMISDKYDPIRYFIRTSEISLDIAIMFINAQCIVDELVQAVKRNVKVRIIADYEYRNEELLQQLENAGAFTLCYVVPSLKHSSMFHVKYVIKDYSNKSGYLCLGSLNWSVTSVMQNYESINFISNYRVVEEFYNHFEKTWQYISYINNTSSIVKMKLNNALINL